MRHLLVFLLLMVLGCTKTTAREIDPAQTVAKVSAALDAVESYRGTVVQTTKLSSLFPSTSASAGIPSEAVVTTEISALLPGKMKLEMAMHSESPSGASGMVMTGVYDGQALWIITKPPGDLAKMGIRVAKISKRVSGAGTGSFDFGYYFQGGGLLKGNDLIGTARQMLASYTFTAAQSETTAAGESCLHLRGTMTAEESIDNLAAMAPEHLAGLVQAGRTSDTSNETALDFMTETTVAVLRGTMVLDMWISTDSLLPFKWSLGDGDTEHVAVVMKNMSYNSGVANGEFVVSPELAEQAMDITDEVVASRKELEPALDNAEAMTALRSYLLKRLEASQVERPAK